MMKINDQVWIGGSRKATIVAIRPDGTVAVLMADTGRMKRVKSSEVTLR